LNVKGIQKDSGSILIKGLKQKRVGDLRWFDSNGCEKQADNDRDKANALQEFFLRFTL